MSMYQRREEYQTITTTGDAVGMQCYSCKDYPLKVKIQNRGSRPRHYHDSQVTWYRECPENSYGYHSCDDINVDKCNKLFKKKYKNKFR